MECHSIEEKLSAYIDNQLSSEEKIQMDEHLKTCPKCSLSLEELRKTIVYTQRIKDVEPPSWLTQKVMSRVKKEAEEKKGIMQKLFYPLYIKIPIEVFATVAIAVTAFYVFKTIEPEMRVAKAPSEQVILSEEKEKSTSVTTPAPAKKQKLKRELGVPSGKAEQQDAPAALAEEETFSQEPYRALETEVKKHGRGRASELRETDDVEQQGITLSVHVRDIDKATEDIQVVIIQLGGKIFKVESFDDKEVLTAGLNTQKVRELNERLRSIGEIEEKEGLLDTLQGDIKIRIEIEQMGSGLES
jgi:anti-sigma factor RsiW